MVLAATRTAAVMVPDEDLLADLLPVCVGFAVGLLLLRRSALWLWERAGVGFTPERHGVPRPGDGSSAPAPHTRTKCQGTRI
jgi:hypothetical protein